MSWVLESNSVFAHIIVAFFYPATLDKFRLFLKIWWQTEPNNPARLIVRNVCAQHSHHDRYLRANTPLYTPDNQEAYLETESSVLSQKCFLGSLMAFIKHLLTLGLHWMCVRVKIHKYRSNHQCFFFSHVIPAINRNKSNSIFFWTNTAMIQCIENRSHPFLQLTRVFELYT